MSSGSPAARTRVPWLLVLIPILAFVALGAWAVSSPVGSSPDDDFHLPSIWCGLGERAGLCELTADPDTRLVPAPLVGEACYTRDPSASAACWDADATQLAETDRVNVGPLYPPVFYGTMSIFASTDVVASVLAMRLFNAALFVGLTTAAAFAVPAGMRRLVVIPFVVTMVPLGMFIVPSTNASSWAILSAGLLWTTLAASAVTTGRRRLALLALAGVAAVLGAGARADAAAFAVLGVIVALVLTRRVFTRAMLPTVLLAVAIVVVSAAFYLSADQSSAVTEGLPTDGPPLTMGQHVDNFLGAPSLWIGIFGGWGLGWLDTPMPAAVSVLGFAVFALALAWGLRQLDARKALAAAGVFAAFWLVPVILLAQSRALVGTHVQPRYILPIAVILAGVLLWGTLRADASPLPTGLVVTGSVLLAFANAVALHIELDRYTKGLDDPSLIPGAGAEWWWQSSPAPWVVWALGVAAFAGLLASLHAVSVRAARHAEPVASS